MFIYIAFTFLFQVDIQYYTCRWKLSTC